MYINSSENYGIKNVSALFKKDFNNVIVDNVHGTNLTGE